MSSLSTAVLAKLRLRAFKKALKDAGISASNPDVMDVVIRVSKELVSAEQVVRVLHVN